MIEKNHPSIKYGNTGVLIINLGTPDSTNWFDIRKYLDFIVDDNEIKHNTFSPNYKIPVYAPNYMYKKKISNVLILAWNKKKYIINKHKRFTNNKGKFILPF